MAAPSITIKRGDSINWSVTITTAGVALNLTGYAVECEVRSVSDRSLAVALTCTPAADQGVSPGLLAITLADTSGIDPGRYVVDLRYTNGSDSRSSETWILNVETEVTER